MKEKQQTFTRLALSALVLLAIVWGFAVLKTTPAPESSSIDGSNKEEGFHGVRGFITGFEHSESSTDGRVQLTIKAERMAVRDKKVLKVFRLSLNKSMDLQEAEASMAIDGEEVLLAKADYGILSKANGEFELNSVRQLTIAGRAVLTSKIKVGREGELKIDSPFQVVDKGVVVMEGNGFRGHVETFVNYLKAKRGTEN